MTSPYKAPFPHCDDLVLHKPGMCTYCDHYPEEQQARIAKGINFTGIHDPTKELCPSEVRRGLDKIYSWGGNVPQNGLSIGPVGKKE